MKKSFLLVLGLGVFSAMGYAQTNLDQDVDAELNKLYSNGSAQEASAAQVSQASQPAAPVSGQPIYILNQATPTATSQSTSSAAAIQKQPTTVIEASPLTESRAEALRKARQEAETSTEAKIVEKLEAARLEDEKRRAQILFGDKLNNQAPAESAPAATQAPVAAPAPQAPVPQIIILPAQPVAPAATEAKKEEVVEPVVSKAVEKEMEAADKADVEMSTSVPAALAPVSQRYFSGIVGVPNVDNSDIQGNYSLGFTFGNKYDETFAVEGSFIYSNYESKNVNNYWYYGRPSLFDVNQYSGAVTGKWYLLRGMVKPVIGGTAQYSYRDFEWSNKNIYRPNLSKSESHSVDIGALVGVDVEFNPTMSIGLEARYMKNLLVRRNYSTDNMNNSYYQNTVNDLYGYRTPVEDLDYILLSLSARVAF